MKPLHKTKLEKSRLFVELEVNLNPEEFNFFTYYKNFEDLKVYLERYKPVDGKYLIKNKGTDNVYRYISDSEEKISKEGDKFYDNVTYTINKYNSRGIRTIDDINDQSVLCNGCSNTFGFGNFENLTWPELTYGDKNINIAVVGDNCNRIIRRTSLILDHKVPKKVVLLLPDINRLDIIFEQPSTGKVWETSGNPILTDVNKGEWHKDLYLDYLQGINPATHYLTTITSLEMLAEKCKYLNVELIVGSWDPYTSKILKPYSKLGYRFIPFTSLGEYPKARDSNHPGKEYHQAIANKLKRL